MKSGAFVVVWLMVKLSELIIDKVINQNPGHPSLSHCCKTKN